MSIIEEYSEKIKRRFFTRLGREKIRIKNMPRFTPGKIDLEGKIFWFHDNMSFLDSYHEIFEKEIYRFHPHPTKRTILDCGANMGLSVLYFSLHYPNHKIIAFEPDEKIFAILEKNIKTFELDNVTLLQRAVWNKEEILEFSSDAGMGGRIGDTYENTTPQKIKAVRLRDYINDDIDFLKIDIEGAETTVLEDCKDLIKKVSKLFFEYHGHYQEPQSLHYLLTLLNENKFHYYIKESSTRQRPFTDTGLICEIFDMAINIFGYHLEDHPGTLKK